MNFLEHKSIKKVLDLIEENELKDTVIAVAVLVVAVASYTGYRWYNARAKEKSYFHMTEIVDSYKKSLDVAKRQQAAGLAVSTEDNPFVDIELILQASQSGVSGSLSAVMLAYQAELEYEKTHDVQKARDMFLKASKKLSSSSYFHDAFALKAASMALDANDSALKAQGLKELQTLADNEKSFVCEHAAYMVGVHALVDGNIDGAITAWQKIAHKGDDVRFASPWAKKATERLQALGIEVK